MYTYCSTFFKRAHFSAKSLPHKKPLEILEVGFSTLESNSPLTRLLNENHKYALRVKTAITAFSIQAGWVSQKFTRINNMETIIINGFAIICGKTLLFRPQRLPLQIYRKDKPL